MTLAGFDRNQVDIICVNKNGRCLFFAIGSPVVRLLSGFVLASGQLRWLEVTVVQQSLAICLPIAIISDICQLSVADKLA